MPVERSCGAIIFHNGKYLLLKYGWGHWGFVKGKIEKGEGEMRTVVREAKEEAGLEKEWLRFIPSFREKISYFYTSERKRTYKEVTYFLVECSVSRIELSHEHTDYAWLPYDEAVRKITYENDRKVLEKAEKFLNE
ncbi:MAG: NUDIX domain-containing protein [Candidatus Thermoplasmatota archaeon]|nr:NUDIX domain-containing protein [Candidatus Thermoplasmatota archaeon]